MAEVKLEDPSKPNAKSEPAAKRAKLVDDREALSIDDILDKHWSVRSRHPAGQFVAWLPHQLQSLLEQAGSIFKAQPMLLQLEAPLKICGDIHGQYHDLLRIFEHSGLPPQADYLFLGDYVDRGKKSIECLAMLFAYKIKFPENFFLLRGNHESPSICRIYGFYDECKRRFSIKMWKSFCDVFNYLPVCATIDDRVICMHGGLSPEMMCENVDVLGQINAIERPADIPDKGYLCDLLWSDPQADIDGFGPNDRGVSVAFGQDIVRSFLRKEDMDLIVRAHQVVEDGYEFFADRSLCTVFSAPNYCGEFDNAAAVLSINENLLCKFLVLRPHVFPAF